MTDLSSIQFTPLVDDSFNAPLKSTLSEGMKENPDDRAKLLDLSSRTGMSTRTIEGDVKGVEIQDRINNVNFEGISKRSPKTSQFLTEFDNAAVAHDDIDMLEQFEESLTSFVDLKKTFKNFGGTVARGFENIIAGTKLKHAEEQQAFMNMLTEDAPPLEEGPVKDLIERRQRSKLERTTELLEQVYQNEEEVKELTPEGLNTVEEGIRAGAQSFIQMMPALAVGGLTRTGATGVLSVMGAQTYGASYASARTQGLSPKEAVLYSTIQAAIEVGTEKLPVDSLIDIFKSASKSNVGKNVVKFMIREMGTEQLATLGQTLTDVGFGLDEELANASSASEIADIQLRRQAVTAVATMVGGGAQAGLAVGVNRVVNGLVSEEATEQADYDAEQAKIDELAEMAGKSKLNERSPEKLNQFLKQVVEEEAEVHLDAVQTQLYMQTIDEELINSDPALQVVAEQLQSEAQINGEVIIPASDFVTKFAQSEHFEVLRPHMTLSSDTVTPFRQESEREQRSDYVRSIVEEAEKSTSIYVEAQAIYISVQEQLIATGRVDAASAKVMAQLIPAYATVRFKDADNIGKTLEEVYGEMGLTIEGPYTEREAAVAEGVADLPTFTQEQDFTDITFEQERVTEQGDRVTITQSAQREWDQTQKRKNTIAQLADCLNG